MAVKLHALGFLLFLAGCNLAITTSTDCGERCEQSRGSLSETGKKDHAIQGHIFNSFTVRRPIDCHMKCFDERCRCQAYQMKGDRCELLEEDRFSASDDFDLVLGYTYFDMNREFAKQVR